MNEFEQHGTENNKQGFTFAELETQQTIKIVEEEIRKSGRPTANERASLKIAGPFFVEGTGIFIKVERTLKDHIEVGQGEVFCDSSTYDRKIFFVRVFMGGKSWDIPINQETGEIKNVVY